jgi:hypothetical protein
MRGFDGVLKTSGVHGPVDFKRPECAAGQSRIAVGLLAGQSVDF